MDFLTGLGLLGLFVASFLAATFFPLSSEAILAGLFYSDYDVVSIWLVAVLGNSLGSYFTFYIGWLAKIEWAEKYLKISHASIEKYKSIINKYSSLIGFLCWVPIVGDPLAFALGFMRVPWKKCFVFICLGKAFRYLVAIYLLSALV